MRGSEQLETAAPKRIRRDGRQIVKCRRIESARREKITKIIEWVILSYGGIHGPRRLKFYGGRSRAPTVPLLRISWAGPQNRVLVRGEGGFMISEGGRVRYLGRKIAKKLG